MLRLPPAVRDDAIDLLSLLKAAETISGEVAMDQLLQRLMGVCLEVAGATRGALVRDEEGTLVVRAVGSVAQGVRCVHTPHRVSTDIPRKLVEQAFASEGAIIVGDVSREPRLADDPCVAASGARAVLVIPIRQKAKPVGVLYLENQLVTFAFSPERVRLLSLLSSQIAISLENSLLFEKLSIEVNERRRAEGSVRFLADAGVLLHQSLDYQATLGRLARLGVPLLADWCLVEVMEDEGEKASRIGAHVDPAREALLHDSRVTGPNGLMAGRIASTVMATGKPWLWSAYQPDAAAELAQALPLQAVVDALQASTISITPLVARGKALGIMVLGSGPRRAAPDRLLAEEVARRAALAVDNARLYREAQRSIRLRDEFLSIASHELNTPLTGLQLAVQGLAAGTLTGTPEIRQRAYDILKRQTRRLVALTSELLDVSRIQVKGLRLRSEPCDLVTLVVDVGERFEAQLADARCPLVLDAHDRVVGRWDRGRLEQVVTNLLSNALKFGAGKPIRVSVQPLPDSARLTVADEGIGIEPDRQSRIFERFERAVSATQYGGLGLGLYIAREIVVAHGGSIAVSSAPGTGAVFTVDLPRSVPGQ
jgi:signal transduction histidine kinase